MSVRHFTAASGEKITVSIGALGFAFGPATVAMVVNKNDAANSIFGAGSTGPAWAVFCSGTGADTNVYFWNGAAAGNAAAVTYASSEGWVLLAVSKATGSVAVRFHKYVYSTNTWVHSNGTVMANSGVPATSCLIGNDASTSPFDGDIAAIAVWNVVLTDTQIEALTLFNSPVKWKGLWRLNQDFTTDNVLDLSGGGADQTAITGTSITATSIGVGFFDDRPPRAEVTNAVVSSLY